MTTMTNAAADLGLPSGSGAGSQDQTPAPMTPAEAFAQRARLLSDPAWKAAFERGDPAKRIEMARVLNSGVRWSIGESLNLNDLSPKIAEEISTQRAAQVAAFRETQVDDLRVKAAIPEEVAAMVRAGTPVSAEEARMAQEERDRLMQDVDFVKRLNANDSAALSRWKILQVIRSAPIKA
ncbi:MAG TPA: hypothetical protein VL048_03685 [Xanthobacteraceae bacterium]|nr:hypothetical protein [Xanthobacteraceae bacterium]